jgi:hypothetical protein
METKKKYSIHSHTEFTYSDDLEEARDICRSMVEVFGSGYIVETETNEVVEIY